MWLFALGVAICENGVAIFAFGVAFGVAIWLGVAPYLQYLVNLD